MRQHFPSLRRSWKLAYNTYSLYAVSWGGAMADDTLYFRLLFVLYPPMDSNARSCHQAEIDEIHTTLLFGLNCAIYFFHPPRESKSWDVPLGHTLQ